MNKQAPSFDPIWEEEIYGQGRHLNRYPYDAVVTFVYSNYPRDRARKDVAILEVGCGTGNNLWFAAREGFSVSGIDGSESAIAYARKRFEEEGLSGDLRVGDFTDLPFADAEFDLVIDRGSLSCVGLGLASRAVAEIFRVLKTGGKFYANPYSDRDSSARSGETGEDGMTRNITGGLLTGVGALCFYTRRDITGLFTDKWRLLSVHHIEEENLTGPECTHHATWRAIAQKL